MRTLNEIDRYLRCEASALRIANEEADRADVANDEAAYDAAKDRVKYHCARIDAMKDERARARYVMLCATVDLGAFSARFQVVQDGHHYSILDTREAKEVRDGLTFGTQAEAIAKEMSYFAFQREQAEKYKINLSTSSRARRD